MTLSFMDMLIALTYLLLLGRSYNRPVILYLGLIRGSFSRCCTENLELLATPSPFFLPSAENSSGLGSKPPSLSAPTHDSPPRIIEECNYLLTYFLWYRGSVRGFVAQNGPIYFD